MPRSMRSNFPVSVDKHDPPVNTGVLLGSVCLHVWMMCLFCVEYPTRNHATTWMHLCMHTLAHIPLSPYPHSGIGKHMYIYVYILCTYIYIYFTYLYIYTHIYVYTYICLYIPVIQHGSWFVSYPLLCRVNKHHSDTTRVLICIVALVILSKEDTTVIQHGSWFVS